MWLRVVNVAVEENLRFNCVLSADSRIKAPRIISIPEAEMKQVE